MPTPFVSVIIPVYNDPVRLKICLQTLERQTHPENSYEVIVIDNGSDESIEPVVAGFRHAKAACEIRQGSYSARNAGISIARGEVLAFIDSDCIPASNWIERGVTNLLENPNYSIIGGKVDFIFKDPDRPTAAEIYDSIMHFNMKMYIEKRNFTGTGNLFTLRSVFTHVGYFDPDLKSGGDYEWGQRAAFLGYKVMYADDVRVGHPARDSFQQLCQKVKRVTKGIHVLSKKGCTPPLKLNRDFFMNFVPPIMTVIRLGRNYRIPVKVQINVILIWFALKCIKMQEQLRLLTSQNV